MSAAKNKRDGGEDNSFDELWSHVEETLRLQCKDESIYFSGHDRSRMETSEPAAARSRPVITSPSPQQRVDGGFEKQRTRVPEGSGDRARSVFIFPPFLLPDVFNFGRYLAAVWVAAHTY
ncbi:unnamed protein product [Linum trigynum]|uniref:Uncharacterized protein n=1 Tax=Linum trigynum TaxID=586398 RepID=A0AAV2FZL2_9ROSI